MISIYCLVDPRNDRPFYVGATNQNLKIRLSGHITELKTFSPKYRSSKQRFIAHLLNLHKKPKIILLHTATLHSVNHYEQFFYLLFIHQGYKLYQKYSAFYYRELILHNKYYKLNTYGCQSIILYSTKCG